MLTVLVPGTHAAGFTEHLLVLPQSRCFGVRRVAAARNQRHWSTSAGAVWPLCPDLSLSFLERSSWFPCLHFCLLQDTVRANRVRVWEKNRLVIKFQKTKSRSRPLFLEKTVEQELFSLKVSVRCWWATWFSSEFSITLLPELRDSRLGCGLEGARFQLLAARPHLSPSRYSWQAKILVNAKLNGLYSKSAGLNFLKEKHILPFLSV